MSFLKKIGWSLGLLLILGLLLGGIAVFQFSLSPISRLKSPVLVKMPPGSGVGHLVSSMKQKGLISMTPIWKLISYFYTYHQVLKAGEYQIKVGDSLANVLDRIKSGDVYLREFTIIEGMTYADIRERLAKNKHLKAVIAHLTNHQVAELLGSKRSSLEGLLFPDTYFYTWGDSDLDLMKQSYAKMQQVLSQAWSSRQSGLPYHTAYEALIAASLIVKETGFHGERPIVSSVIVNRLRKKMRLQIDPTVSYGLGYPERRRLTRSDLRRYTAYNTYQRAGLPPTPIAMPGLASIQAALHPAHTGYLFYVSKGDGSHQFSQTYRQHLHAIRRYLRKNKPKSGSVTAVKNTAPFLCQFIAKSGNVHASKVGKNAFDLSREQQGGREHLGQCMISSDQLKNNQ